MIIELPVVVPDIDVTNIGISINGSDVSPNKLGLNSYQLPIVSNLGTILTLSISCMVCQSDTLFTVQNIVKPYFKYLITVPSNFNLENDFLTLNVKTYINSNLKTKASNTFNIFKNDIVVLPFITVLDYINTNMIVWNNGCKVELDTTQIKDYSLFRFSSTPKEWIPIDTKEMSIDGIYKFEITLNSGESLNHIFIKLSCLLKQIDEYYRTCVNIDNLELYHALLVSKYDYLSKLNNTINDFIDDTTLSKADIMLKYCLQSTAKTNFGNKELVKEVESELPIKFKIR